MFATSARKVMPRTKQNISAMKTMVTIFFRSTRLLVLNFLPKGTKFNQDYFIGTVFPNLYSEKRRIARRKSLPSFSVHMDNSMCHNGTKITEKLEKRHIVRAPHPPYSPDLSPCDFWFFGILKRKMKEPVFQSEEQSLAAITENWNELTFEDIQRVFHNRMERLIWVIANSGEYCQS
jgi:transposase